MEQEILNEQTPLNGTMDNEAQDYVVENVNNEVSESVNEDSEELSGVEQENQVGEDDYSKYELQDLLAKLNQLINNHPVETIINAVEEIKSAFYKQYRINYQEARENFIEQGGVPENFKFADEHQEVTFKELYSQFRDKKAAYNQQLSAEREANQNKRLEIIEKIKNLINNEESINKTFQEFHDLQQQWRDCGQAAPNDMKKLWDSYNHVVEQFYDYVKINRELRDLDLKENLKAKTELCEKAEALTLEESVVEAFRSLQALHDKWREIGPVPNDQKEEIWDRFKAATTIINKKHQDFFEKQKDTGLFSPFFYLLCVRKRRLYAFDEEYKIRIEEEKLRIQTYIKWFSAWASALKVCGNGTVGFSIVELENLERVLGEFCTSEKYTLFSLVDEAKRNLLKMASGNGKHKLVSYHGIFRSMNRQLTVER